MKSKRKPKAAPTPSPGAPAGLHQLTDSENETLALLLNGEAELQAVARRAMEGVQKNKVVQQAWWNRTLARLGVTDPKAKFDYVPQLGAIKQRDPVAAEKPPTEG